MSRFVEVRLQAPTLEPVLQALTVIGVRWERGDEPLLLAGGLECADEPVDVKILRDGWNTASDFGLSLAAGDVRLLCGEHDLPVLTRTLLPRLRAELARAALARTTELEVGQVLETTDGRLRLSLRPRR